MLASKGLVSCHTHRWLSRSSALTRAYVGAHIPFRAIGTKKKWSPYKRVNPFKKPAIITPKHEPEDPVETEAAATTPETVATTPAMRQYNDLKLKYPGSILLFKLGDFYEMFNDDAKQAASILDIALTARRTSLAEIPMCGFPCHALDTYLGRFMKRGLTVAICDQMDPAGEKKGLIRREVVRVVTPGTVYEDRFLNPRKNNYLAVIYSQAPLSPTSPKDSMLHLAWLDISTGHFFISSTTVGSLGSELARLSPSEILLSAPLKLALAAWVHPYHVTEQEMQSLVQNEERLYRILAVPDKEYLNEFSDPELAAAGSLLAYVEHTQKGCIPHVRYPQRFSPDAVLGIDFATRRSLEVQKTLSGERKGSLLHVMDQTLTGPGARMLNSRLQSPILDIGELNHRLDFVEFFTQNPEVLRDVREALQRCHDLERGFQRINLGRGGPRDLAMIGKTLVEVHIAKSILINLFPRNPKDKKVYPLDTGLGCISRLGTYDTLVDELSRALKDNPPVSPVDGHFISPGYNAELDEQHDLQSKAEVLMDEIKEKYREVTGISNLKVKRTDNLGYFFEIQPVHKSKVEQHGFVHCQTLVNAMRYKNQELYELEDRINRSQREALRLELEIFESLVQMVIGEGERIVSTTTAIAALDVAAGLATLANARGYTRPRLHNNVDLNITHGRHPIVESAQAEQGAQAATFVGNDLSLTPDANVLLITGPNMGGKSTYLRQNALIAIMAQMGSFVPAQEADIGIVDKIFCRVGASDDLANDRSTFMVEMVETAAIVSAATPQSLVIMDEIGRGTSTTDGLALAWSILEHLHDVNRSRTLFATHYHELTAIVKQLKHVACYTLAIQEAQGDDPVSDVVFSHKVIPGVASRSYGVLCAKLAGVPQRVIARATQILKVLEKEEHRLAVHSIPHSRTSASTPTIEPSLAPEPPVPSRAPSPSSRTPPPSRAPSPPSPTPKPQSPLHTVTKTTSSPKNQVHSLPPKPQAFNPIPSPPLDKLTPTQKSPTPQQIIASPKTQPKTLSNQNTTKATTTPNKPTPPVSPSIKPPPTPISKFPQAQLPKSPFSTQKISLSHSSAIPKPTPPAKLSSYPSPTPPRPPSPTSKPISSPRTRAVP